MKITRTSNQLKNKEDGFSAIVVTLIILGLVTLISIGFVRTVSREQRASLDRQLSTQAFYAAETGVNDAAELLASGGVSSTERKEDCNVSDITIWNSQLGTTEEEGVEYTCVLIDPLPGSLEFSSVGTDTVRDIRLVTSDSSPVGNILISWQAEDFPADPDDVTLPTSSDSTFPESFGNAAPVLRVAFTPLGDLSRQALVENTMTLFLRPYYDSSGAIGTTPFSAGASNIENQGRIIEVACNPSDDTNPRICNHRVNLSGGSSYLMTVRAMYFNASMRIESLDDNFFVGEQAIVDSTGRSSDVLQRIQVRVPLRERFDLPAYAIEANQICKPFTIRPGDGDIQGLDQAQRDACAY